MSDTAAQRMPQLPPTVVNNGESKKLVIGYKVTPEERDEIAALAKQMSKTRLPHPHFPGHFIEFLPRNDASIGTLVKLATKQYINYFKSLRDNPPPVEPQPGAAGTQLTDAQAQHVKVLMQQRQAMAGGGI